MNRLAKHPSVGILGIGKLGTTLGQLAVAAGYRVLMATDKAASEIKLIVETIVPGAQAVSQQQLFALSNLVILAIPLSRFQTIAPKQAEHVLIVDAMNYWWEVDGTKNIYSTPEHSSSELVQQHFADSVVVKALNHMGYHDLQTEAKSPGANGRKAIAVAGDYEQVVRQVEQLVDALGFVPLNIGALRRGVILEPGSPLSGADLPLGQLKKLADEQLQLRRQK